MDPLYLHAQGLLSKFGFSDGDAVDEWLWDQIPGYTGGVDDTSLLVDLVKTHLLPVLVDWDVVVVEIETSHNPIRAEFINGVEVDWYGAEWDEHPVRNISAEVPADVVLAAAERFGLVQ